jgi:integrase
MMQQAQPKSAATRADATTVRSPSRPIRRVGTLLSTRSEDGVDRRFIQVQVGHECDSSTAIYTHVSDDFMSTALRKALAPAFEEPARRRKEQ